MARRVSLHQQVACIRGEIRLRARFGAVRKLHVFRAILATLIAVERGQPTDGLCACLKLDRELEEAGAFRRGGGLGDGNGGAA